MFGASLELAPNMFGKFGASSELVRSWFEAEIWPIIQLASSDLARASRFAAKFHYASWFGAGSEPASVMEFGTNQLRTCSEPAPNYLA